MAPMVLTDRSSVEATSRIFGGVSLIMAQGKLSRESYASLNEFIDAQLKHAPVKRAEDTRGDPKA